LEVIQQVVRVDRKSKLKLSEADRELAIDFLNRIVDPQSIKQAAQYLPGGIFPDIENQTDILSEFARLRIEIDASLKNVDGCNILVLGKTGAGKSSLLNYLVGQKLCEAGVGMPVTGKGIYKHEATLNNIIVNIYDSWGIEAGDKFEEWEKLISNEKEKHNATKDSSEWFHAIIYCIQAGGHRVEDIDSKIINQFRNDRFYLIPVLTKADQCSKEDAKLLKETLSEQCHIEASSIIDVCAEKKDLPGGGCETFGGDLLKKVIMDGYCATLVERLPERFIYLAIEEIKRFQSEMERAIDNRKIGYFDSGHELWLQQEIASFIKQFNDQGFPNIIRGEIERSVRTGETLSAMIDYHGDSIFCSSGELFDANDPFWVNSLKAIFCAVVVIPTTVYVLIRELVSGEADTKEKMKTALDSCCDKLIKSVEDQKKPFHEEVKRIFTPQKSLPECEAEH
jgi:GTP-binding protein EngB required for normal cell division